MPLVNTLVLRNLLEYLHQSYIARTIHWATFSSHYGSTFNYHDVVGFKISRIQRKLITQINRRYAV